VSALPEVPLEDFNARASAFLAIHRAAPSESYIANVRSHVDAVQAGGALLPVTVNDGEVDNAWVCSPYTTYCRYALEEVARFGHPWLSAPLGGVIRAAGAMLRRQQIDRAVVLNNWLVSTNCYPRLHDVDLEQAIGEARARWPDHAIWFRSLNTVHHADWLQSLAAHGAALLPSRQVYLFDRVAESARRHRDLKSDLALLRNNHGVTCVEVADDPADLARAAALYHELYIDKYSTLNPRYGVAFLREWGRAGLLRLHGLRDADGVLQGVVGLFAFGNLVTSPIVGYNAALPQKLGLYRRLAACVLQHAAARGQLVNLSAGVPHFKRQRGGCPAIEYSAVMVDHLPAARRYAIRALGYPLRGVGVPIMKRFGL